MEGYENYIYDTLNRKIHTPQSYKRAIETALYSEKKHSRNSLIKVILATCGGIILTTGVAFAGYTIYEKIWKEPRQYDVNQEKPAIISEEEKSELVTEDEIKEKSEGILKDFGYPDKKIKKIDLNRSYDDSLNSYYAVYTEDEYSIPNSNKNIGITINFNSETGEFIYFLNNDFTEIKSNLEKISEEEALNLCVDLLTKLEYPIDSYVIKTCENKEGNEWVISYSRSYNGVYNRYDEFQIAFGRLHGNIIVESVIGLMENNFENNEYVISEEEAINIAKAKEEEFSGEPIINITAKKSIEKMNQFVYCLENNIEEQTSVRTENRIRNVWVVKIEHEKEPKNKDNTLSNIESVKRYMSKKYYIDATTGEIIGGDQAKFNLD